MLKIAIVALASVIATPSMAQFSPYNRGYNDGYDDSSYRQRIEQSNIEARQYLERLEREREAQRNEINRAQQESFDRMQREEELESLRRRYR
jgi:predicted ribosome quality control (RQC) complex YloA/Tae2 family protein